MALAPEIELEVQATRSLEGDAKRLKLLEITNKVRAARKAAHKRNLRLDYEEDRLVERILLKLADKVKRQDAEDRRKVKREARKEDRRKAKRLDARNKKVVEMRDSGKSFNDIGKQLNISRQRACKIYQETKED